MPLTVTMYPTGVGETGIGAQIPDSGAHWQKVDDVGAHDSDATYVYTQANGENLTQRDMYSITNTVPLGAVISNTTIYVVSKYSDANGIHNVWTELKIGANYYESDAQNVTNTYAPYSRSYDTNPSSGLAWVQSDYNSLLIGVKHNVAAAKLTKLYTTQVYIVVTYTQPPAANPFPGAATVVMGQQKYRGGFPMGGGH